MNDNANRQLPRKERDESFSAMSMIASMKSIFPFAYAVTSSHRFYSNERDASRQHRDVRQRPQRRASVLQLLLLLGVRVHHHVTHVHKLDVVLHHQPTARRGEQHVADVRRWREGLGSAGQASIASSLVRREVNNELNGVEGEGTTHRDIAHLEIAFTHDETPRAARPYCIRGHIKSGPFSP